MPFINGIGPGELIIILIIALIVVGPGKLPEVGSALGKSIREFRNAATDIKDSVSLNPTPAPTPAPVSTPAPVVAPAPVSTAAPVPPAPLVAPAAAETVVHVEPVALGAEAVTDRGPQTAPADEPSVPSA